MQKERGGGKQNQRMNGPAGVLWPYSVAVQGITTIYTGKCMHILCCRSHVSNA